MHLCGIILEGEQLVALDVEVDLRVITRRGGARYWEGNMLVTPEAPVRDGGRYTLRLDDGQEGEIIVGGGPYIAGRAYNFPFKGNGRPPSAGHG